MQKFSVLMHSAFWMALAVFVFYHGDILNVRRTSLYSLLRNLQPTNFLQVRWWLAQHSLGTRLADLRW